MYYKKVFILTLMILFSASVMATTYYEDGEPSKYSKVKNKTSMTSQWKVYDNEPTGAKIASRGIMFGAEKAYIKLRGDGRRNSYMNGARKSKDGGWNNRTEKQLHWKMKFDEKFKISVYTQTTKGLRIFLFDYKDYDKGFYAKRYIHIGLGKESKNGKWQTFSRNLEADLKKYEPNNKIVSVNGFKVQGSGEIAYLYLSNNKTEEGGLSLIVSKAIEACRNKEGHRSFSVCLSEEKLAYIIEDGRKDEGILYVVDLHNEGEIVAKKTILPSHPVTSYSMMKLENTPLIYMKTNYRGYSYSDTYSFYYLDKENSEIKEIFPPNFKYNSSDVKLVMDRIGTSEKGKKLEIGYHKKGEKDIWQGGVYDISNLPTITLLNDKVNPVISYAKDVCLNKKKDKQVVCIDEYNLVYIAPTSYSESRIVLYAISSLGDWSIIDKIEDKDTHRYIGITGLYKIGKTPLLFSEASDGHGGIYEIYYADSKKKTLKKVFDITMSMDSVQKLTTLENGKKLRVQLGLKNGKTYFDKLYDISDYENIKVIDEK